MAKEKCEHKWIEPKDLYAVTRLDKEGNKLTFLPSVGIPVVVQICEDCGEIKIFSAKIRGRM